MTETPAPAPRDNTATDVECGMWAERIRQITATWATPLGGSEAWEIARYAVLPHLAAGPPDTAAEVRDRTETTEAALQRIAAQCVEAEAARDERIAENARPAAALGRVEALHQPETLYLSASSNPNHKPLTMQRCSCQRGLAGDPMVVGSWPCPTIAALPDAGTEETGGDDR